MRTDTALEELDQHLRQGEARVARQLELVLRLEQERHGPILPLAQTVLSTMQDSLSLFHAVRELLVADRQPARTGDNRRPLSRANRTATIDLLLHAIVSNQPWAVTLLTEMLENTRAAEEPPSSPPP